MGSVRARQNRGKRTNVVVAAWLALHGHPRAEPTVGSETGHDVKHVDGYSIEVKARADFNPLAWWRQARANARNGQVPVCIMRCNGQGENAEDYLVFMRLEDHELNKMRGLDGPSDSEAAERQAGNLQ